MEAEPKASTDSEATQPAQLPGQLPPTEGMTGELIKGRYLLGPELGRGGFAITYLATDLEVASRKVVVKILNEWRSNHSWALKKFRSEMEALARIDHPNVVSVVDFGQRENGKPFLVMQYVPGHSLRRLIPRSGLPLAQVVQMMKQTGRALSAAHEVGVCHRDLKPENIMVQAGADGEEQIKLIDFGIATIEQIDSNSQSSSTVGTYVYMAPEQFQGKSSPASDIYQMGVLAYELVTGIVPFRAPSLGDLVLQKMEGLKVLPQDLRPDLPEAAQEIILKAMALQPSERFQKARDFGDALAAALVSGNWETLPLHSSDVRRSSTAYRRAHQLRKRRRLQSTLAVALLVLGVVIFGAFYFFSVGRAPGTTDSVAVLPFSNQTGDPQFAYLTDGMTESLINDLSRIPTVRVSARGSVLKYESRRIDARTAGRELGVSRIVTGSVSRQGDTFAFYVELIEVESGMRLWGNRYNGNMATLTATLQQFSTEVTDQLRLKLSKPIKERIARQFAVGSEPYQNYLKGRFHLNRRTSAGFRDAIRYFNQAIATDPNYAPAYSGLANTYAIRATFGSAYGGETPALALRQARTAADHALELDGTLSEAYVARGIAEMQSDYNWAAAEQDFMRAIQLNPNWSEAHEFYAFVLGASERFEEATREIEVADHLEPSSVGITLAKGLILHMAGRHDESFGALKRLAADPVGRVVSADQIAAYYWVKGMPDKALATVEAVSPILTPHMRVPLLAAAYAHVGQNEKARRILGAYKVQPESAWWYYLVLADLALRDTNEALTNLEHAYEQRYWEVVWLGVDPMLTALHDQPRFRALLHRVQPTKTKG